MNEELFVQGIPLEEGTVPESTAGHKEDGGMERKQRLTQIGRDFGFFGGLSVLCGIAASFCLYRNPLGITVPLFVAVTYGLAYLVFKKLGIPIKRESIFVAAVSLLIGISTCFTMNLVVGYFMNRLALVLLFCIFILHQCHQDRKWSIGKYMLSILMYIGETFGMLCYPFRHLLGYVSALKDRKYRNVLGLLAGVGAAVPAVILLCILLSSADMVFQDMMDTIIYKILNPVTLFLVVLEAVVAGLAMYCMICSAYGGTITDEPAPVKRFSPMTAISFMSVIGLVYLAFCGIQVVYLFMGKGSLPEGMNYAQYARQGFFQLLSVAVLNLVMVLLCLKYFKKNVILDGILLLISLCTYVMLASAIFRMLLYVGQYHLTFLRVLVLWFLAMMVVLMAGVVILICRNGFPVFQYFLVTISVFYLVFAWMRPDYRIAEYNIAHGNVEEDYREWDYLAYLSPDAAPAVMKMEDSETKRILLEEYVLSHHETADEKTGMRAINFSDLESRRIWREYSSNIDGR